MERKKLVKLKEIRKSRKLSGKDLSILSGVAEITIHSLEEGCTNIDNIKLSTLLKLSKALKVKPSALLNEDMAKQLR